jgi:hypothetical protein
MPSSKVSRAIRAFEKAVEGRASLGMIPLYCDDKEEQAALDNARTIIEHNYVKARAKLERLMEEK